MSRQKSPPKAVFSNALEEYIKSFFSTELSSIIEMKLSELLPKIVETVQSSISSVLEEKMKDLSHNFVNNSPPPPSSEACDHVSRSYLPLNDKRNKLGAILQKRIKRYYQKLRHDELANLFSENIMLDEPK